MKPGLMFMGQIRWPKFTFELKQITWVEIVSRLQKEHNKLQQLVNEGILCMFKKISNIFERVVFPHENFQAAYSASGPILHVWWMSILLASFFLILSTFLERYSVVFRSQRTSYFVRQNSLFSYFIKFSDFSFSEGA